MHSKQKLADFIHLLFCPKAHETNLFNVNKRIDDKCYYIVEEQVAEKWLQPDHLAWLNECDHFIGDLELKDYQQALDLLVQVIKVSKELRELLNKYPKIRPYLTALNLM